KVDNLNDAQLSDAFKFVGSATSGLGGFAQTFSQFTDPLNGIIAMEQQGLTNTDKTLQTQITTLTDRITVMQNNLAKQLQTADALIGQLQSQQQTLNASLQGLSLVLYGRNTSQSG